MREKEIGIGEAHRHFAASCFNKTWEILDLPSPTPEQIDEMLHLAHASFWHWTQVADHTAVHLSVGLWLVSRTYAVAEHADRARYFAEQCLELSRGSALSPFYLGYGYEALARAELVAGHPDDAADLLRRARELAEDVEDEGERSHLVADLQSLTSRL